MMITQSERVARFKLSLVPQIGPLNFKKILSKFGSAESFWQSYESSGLFKSELLTNMRYFHKEFDIDAEIKLIEKKNIQFIVLGDESYPNYLSQISDPPPVLFFKGDIVHLSRNPMFAVVGSRKLTSYGKQVVAKILPELCDANLTIVSGMAMGVDREVHLVAIRQSHPNIAVLATSPDKPSPISNTDIYNKIIENGCIVSETYKESKFEKGLFPRRNRIIAGMSVGTLIVEADEKSGALITANVALNENREVFAIPGNIGQQMSRGTNKLIQDGKAKLVQNVEDILSELNLERRSTKSQSEIYQPDNDDESKLLSLLQNKSMGIDEIKNSLDIDLGRIISTLSILELKGVVSKREDGKFTYVTF